MRLAPLGLLGVMLINPKTTQACDPDPCAMSEKWQEFELRSVVVATDGVLVLEGRRGPWAFGMSDVEAAAFVSAEVTADGQPIAGALEVEDGWRGIIWRPAAPFTAGATLSLTLTVDNDALATAAFEDSGCEPWDLDLGPFVAQVGDGPMPALGTVETNASDALTIYETVELDTLVCCDGAYPETEYTCDEEVVWSSGQCAATEGVGWLAASWSVDFDPLAPELAANVGWRVVSDSYEFPAYPTQVEIRLSRQNPVCGHIELRNHATGAVVVLDEQCFGEDRVGSLGPINLDPAAALSDCAGTPYVCEIAGDSWDPDTCVPTGDGGGDGDGGDGDGDGTGDETGDGPGADAGSNADGCSCSTDAQPLSPWLAAGLLLLGLGRRRTRANCDSVAR